MALSPGKRLGPYEILSPLGAGGMGEVYRARHLKLGRDVAIKVLPQELASHPERLQRFEREARAASSLNHPNTVTIHDIDEQDGVHYIAMELVEGQTLRDRLGKGPLPVGGLVGIATQIAAGLATAHTAGIVHRDLKPENIMITQDGLVKILDFGLAKLAVSPEAPSALTTAQEVTRAGEVLGTAPYMSPEQAAGRPVDFRSDQFSFGSILYEMATGRRAFEKDSSPQTLAAIIEAEPAPVDTLNDNVPAPLVTLIERCLSKDPRGRYDSTGDLAKELARASAPAPRGPSGRWLAVAGLVALVAVVTGVFSWQAFRLRDSEISIAPLVAVPLTSYSGAEEEPSFSPDGSQVAFSWDGESRRNRDIYVKVVGTEQPLRLTSDPARDGSPAWSPDGRQIAFLRAQPGAGSRLLLVSPTGGAERLLADVDAAPGEGLAWSPDSRRLAFADRPSSDEPRGLFLLDIESGLKERLTSAPPEYESGDSRPAFSPDGGSVAFFRSYLALHVVAAAGGEPREVLSAWRSRIAWTSTGEELLFSAVPLNREEAPPTPSPGYSGTPTLWRVPVDGSPARQLSALVNGRDVAVSRKGNRLAYAMSTSDGDIWRIDLEAPASRDAEIRLISSTRLDGNPQFSPDDERVAFTSGRSGRNQIWVADKNGRNLLRVTSLGERGDVGSPRWSSDGESIAFDFGEHGPARDSKILVVRASGGAPRRVTTGSSLDYTPSWSRDGRWIYFGSNRSGEWQVWKVPSEGETEGSAHQVTRGGGFLAIESVDGRTLYYAKKRSGRQDPENSIWRVSVEGGDEEVVIESLRSGHGNWDVTAKGIYFLDESTSPSGAAWGVRFFSFEHGRSTDVARVPEAPTPGAPAFSVSSDGRWILAMRIERTSDLMLVEDFR